MAEIYTISKEWVGGISVERREVKLKLLWSYNNNGGIRAELPLSNGNNIALYHIFISISII